MTEFGLTERRSRRIVGLSRSVQHYRPSPKNDGAVVDLGLQVRARKRRKLRALRPSGGPLAAPKGSGRGTARSAAFF